jgi:putative ABC transport system ATP-binding protein
MPESGFSISCRSVRKVYEGASPVVALDGIDLEIGAGEFTAIVGPSGCGKSTLLHLIGGIDRPSSGQILAGGRDLARLDETERTLYRRRQVGTVFQFFNLLPHLTIFENVALPLVLDARPHDASVRARELLERVGLGERQDAYPYELSGGQMQRVAVARALSARPGVLIADEPTGNLDSQTGGAVLDLIEQLRREQGVTVVLATHEREAARRAGRTMMLKDGRIV